MTTSKPLKRSLKQTENFMPKKRFGQNFLVNKNILDRIITTSNLKSNDIILEIGPGKGILTKAMAPKVKKIICIEKDRQLVELLKKEEGFSNIKIIAADILKYSFDQLPNNLKLVSNVPYNISTPIIEKIIHSKHKFNTVFLTVQLEYGQRIVAQPNTKNYGAFSLFVQYHCQPKLLFKIPPSAFRPKPKVSSCFLQLNLYREPKHKIAKEDFLFLIIRHAFSQRRKTILNSLSQLSSKAMLEKIFNKQNINSTLRAENLSMNDYIRICNTLLRENNKQGTNLGKGPPRGVTYHSSNH